MEGDEPAASCQDKQMVFRCIAIDRCVKSHRVAARHRAFVGRVDGDRAL